MHSMNDYSSAIQLRSDRWSALREAASGLTRATTAKETDALRSKCAALFDSLSLIEPYWAFPGMSAFDHMRRQFAHGNFEDLAFAVNRVTRALTTGAYRRRTIPLDWTDYNGHMTESRYLHAFADATDRFMEIIGCDAAYISSGGSYFTAETHIRHLDEVHAGAVIDIRTQVIAGAGKKMHLFLSLIHI